MGYCAENHAPKKFKNYRSIAEGVAKKSKKKLTFCILLFIVVKKLTAL